MAKKSSAALGNSFFMVCSKGRVSMTSPTKAVCKIRIRRGVEIRAFMRVFYNRLEPRESDLQQGAVTSINLEFGAALPGVSDKTEK